MISDGAVKGVRPVMRFNDQEKAYGIILGKVLSSFENGSGLVSGQDKRKCN